MRFNIHAGHNPDGKIASGAVGYIKESTEARKVKNELIKILKSQGHTVYDCTCENGTSQRDVLNKIVAKCNAHSVDCDISIHFNSSNGQGYGTEVLYKTSNGSKWATKVQNTIVKECSFRDRGIKKRDNLYFLNNTKNVAILIECCFCDNKNDVNKYNYKKIAQAIAYSLTGKKINEGNNNMNKIIAYVGDVDLVSAKVLNWKLKDYVLKDATSLKEKNIEKLIAVGGGAAKILPNANIKLVGDDRYKTIRKVLDYLENL